MASEIRRTDPRTADWLRSHAARAARLAFGPSKRAAHALGVGVRHARKVYASGGVIGHALEIVASAPEPHHIVAAVRIAARIREYAGMDKDALFREYAAARLAAVEAAHKLNMLLLSLGMDELEPEERASALEDVGHDMAAAGERLAAISRKMLERT